VGANLLISSSCFLVWNVRHVLFQTIQYSFQLVKKSYTNVCANTDVFLDGDFISAFASLVCHHNHSTTPTVPIKSGKDVPQLTHVTFPNSVLVIKDCKQLPKGIQCIVAMMHTKLHHAVMEITVDTKTIKIFDGLRLDLLEWKDHVIRVMRIFILVDPNVDCSAALFHPDHAVSKTVGHSRNTQEYVNGFDVIIALQRWRLERGSFLHQSNGNNCGSIACLKIMELFHAIDVEAAREVYEQKWLSGISWWSFAAMIFRFLFWRNRTKALIAYASVATTYLLWKSFFFHAARPVYTDTVFLMPLQRMINVFTAGTTCHLKIFLIVVQFKWHYLETQVTLHAHSKKCSPRINNVRRSSPRRSIKGATRSNDVP
jgi:hypothetical protein